MATIIRSVLFCWMVVIPTFVTGDDEYFTLKNHHSGLVLDLKDDSVILQSYTGVDTQLWKLEPAVKGSYYFINKDSGKVLDFDNPGKVWIGDQSNIVVNKKIHVTGNGCPVYNRAVGGKVTNMGYCQQWYIHFGGIIVNSCGTWAVSVMGEDYRPEVHLKSATVSAGGKHQKFDFDYILRE